jgi:hypothetical protein
MAIQDTRFAPMVRLTPVDFPGTGDVHVTISQLIAYSQNDGFTRLRLTGGKMLDVKETTDRIDYLIRCACAAQ